MTQVAVGVVVHAEPARLHATLAAVEQVSRRPREVILLGDGPEPGVTACLAELGRLRQSSTQQPVGPPACFNRLAEETDADVVILLESGSIPAPGALDLLVDAVSRDRRVGLAGPSTNQAWNEQGAFPGAGPRAVVQTAREAARRYGTATRPLEPLHSLADFCLAIRREVIDAIGGADEGYGLGPCWELEYNARAARAGFRGVWVCGAYVWRAPFTTRRAAAEARLFDSSRRRYQDSLCGLRLRGLKSAYEPHCRGDDCEHFAPRDLVQLRRPLAPSESSPGLGAARVHVAEPPLVSCVMPTRGRPDFVRQAVRIFERQDYENRELVIAGELGDQLEAVVPASPRIRYVKCPPGESIGAKRNRACAAARGAFIAQWDDDDWYAPWRLSVQLAPLLSGRADITGLRSWAFFDLARWQFWTVTPALHRRLFVGDVHGGTLAFTKPVWDRLSRYPNASLAEDAAFLVRAQARGARLERIDGDGLFVYLRHARNAWSFTCGVHVDRDGWRQIPEPELPAADRAFYARHSGAAPVGAGTAGDAAPLVTCVMPTHNRRSWIERSVTFFLRQDFPSRELLILDDGEDSVADLVPDDPRIRYIALDRPLLLGEKRNYGCELARGEIIAHWDDDDWQAPHRLRYQVGELERHGAALCGPGRVLYLDPTAPRAWQYEYPQHARRWVAGNALCYRKDLWRENRFASVQVGEDTRFVWSQRAGTPLVLADHRFFVALIHSSNTSRKVTAGSYWRPHPLEDVRSLLGEDFGLYVDRRQELLHA